MKKNFQETNWAERKAHCRRQNKSFVYYKRFKVILSNTAQEDYNFLNE